jgi:hypothetical protein
MPGQRKTLGALVDQGRQQLEHAAASPSATSPDRTDKPAEAAAPAAPAKPPAAAGDMTMRSWYMPKASADRLAALVDDVHFATRLPKHLIMGAVVNVIDRHRDEVEAEARAAGGEPQP